MRTTISLVGVVFAALLVSGCPGGKKRNSAQEACAKISNTVMIGNECQCQSGYTKLASSGGGSYDFQCQHSQTCVGNATRVDNTCQCNNGKVYNPSNTSSPCGEVVGDGRLGLTAQQLETACSGVGRWQNQFCLCDGVQQQFNALTRQCEPIMWRHTQAMCGTGATFYGQGGQGVCVCQNPQALFHPSFGGCSTLMDTPVIDSMCKNLYGISEGHVGGRCACPQGVWFRGSCLSLDNDFVTQVPSLPPELRCELQGKREINGNCQDYGGGYIGHGNAEGDPIICRRNSLDVNIGKETIEMWSNLVRVTVERAGRSYPEDFHPQAYFRLRCEQYAFSPSPAANRNWAKGIGKYTAGSPPYFGECTCGAGHTVTYDHDLGYSYCIANGYQMYAPHRCEFATLCEDGINIGISADRTVSGSISMCRPDGTKLGVTFVRPR